VFGASAARVAAALSFTLVVFARAPRAERPLDMLRPPAAPDLSCGTSLERDVRAPRSYAVSQPKDGELLSFEQDPPLVPADYAGPIVFRNFEVIGDVDTLQFHRADAPVGAEIWRRVTTRSVGGRLVSVFQPAWSARDLDAVMSQSAYGFDGPGLYWGTIASPATGATTYIYLRMALGGVPPSQVVRINDRVQFASNVVNLVVPGFGDARVNGGVRAFELSDAANLFYQYFDDQYDVLAFVPQATPAGDYGAFHKNVRNRVMGLNLPLLDQSASYGSAGVLQGVEVYTGVTATRYAETNHEMAHQWGSSFDWSRIAGITRAGHEPSAHAPLWTGGETLLSSVLSGTRRVHASAAGYDIERTPTVGFHPMDLYAMGVLPENQVPEFGVFVDQNQLEAMTPEIGKPLIGPARRITIADVVREHGVREGPAPTRWRRATVLISRDRLASQQEMDYWNFFAERLADRRGGGTPTADGYVPFRVATHNAVTLSTAIVARRAAALPQVLDTDTPAFGALDWRGVSFDPPVRQVFAANDDVLLTGHVTAGDAVDFDRIAVAFWNEGVAAPITFAGDIGRSGDFTVPVHFTADHRGRYVMSVYLFWPGSGPQRPRASVTSVAVR
jgi:hypothetical protein